MFCSGELIEGQRKVPVVVVISENGISDHLQNAKHMKSIWQANNAKVRNFFQQSLALDCNRSLRWGRLQDKSSLSTWKK